MNTERRKKMYILKFFRKYCRLFFMQKILFPFMRAGTAEKTFVFGGRIDIMYIKKSAALNKMKMCITKRK